MELIQKIHSLQKRLIARNEDIVDRQLSLAEKDKQLSELRAGLARQPGEDVIAEARSLRTELQKKAKVIQSLVAERNMYMTENLQGRQRLDALAEELSSARRQALDLSKKYQKLKEAKPLVSAPQSMAGHTTTTISLLPATTTAPSKPKFVGGGFNLTSSMPMTSS